VSITSCGRCVRSGRARTNPRASLRPSGRWCHTGGYPILQMLLQSLVFLSVSLKATVKSHGATGFQARSLSTASLCLQYPPALEGGPAGAGKDPFAARSRPGAKNASQCFSCATATLKHSALDDSAVALDSLEAAAWRSTAWWRSNESTGFPAAPSRAAVCLPSSHGIPKPARSSPSERIIESQQASCRRRRAVAPTVGRRRKVLARAEACSLSRARLGLDHPFPCGSFCNPDRRGGGGKTELADRAPCWPARHLLPVSRTEIGFFAKNIGEIFRKNRNVGQSPPEKYWTVLND
jgi:hypothetical protein